MKVKSLRSLLLLFSLVCYTAQIDAQPRAKAKQQPSSASQVPFQYYQSLIFVKAKVNGGRTNYLFLVNTGANATVIDKRTGNLLKLPVIREADSVTGTAGREYVSLCDVKSIDIGGKAIVKDMQVTKRDLSKFVTMDGQKIDGILGTDFLQHFAVTIDFGQKKMSFATKKTVIVKQKTIPFTMVEGIPRFTVRLNDTFDTYLHYNSGVSMLPSSNNYINLSDVQWSALKKINPYVNHASYFTGQGVGGSVYMQVVRISNAQLNCLNLYSPYIIIQSREGYFLRDDAIGFFGNNLLEKQKKVTIDFLGECIVLENPQRPATKTRRFLKKRIT